MSLVPRVGLAVRLALSAVLVGLALGLVLGGLRMGLELRAESRRIDGAMERMLAMVHEPAVQACYSLDKSLAERVANGLRSYDPIRAVTITDDFGESLANWDRPETPVPGFLAQWISGWRTAYDVPLVHVGSQPRVGRQVGMLSVRLDNGLIVRNFLRQAGLDLAGNMARDIVLAGILALLFHMVLTRPLLRLAGQVSSIDPARPAQRQLDVGQAGRGNELGLLTASLNRLLGGFEQSLEARRSAQRDIQEREAFIQGLMDSVPDGVLAVNAGGRVEAANPAARRMFARAGRVLGAKASDLVLPPQGEELGRIIAGFHASGDPETLRMAPAEARVLDPSGAELDLELRYSAMTAPGGSLVVCLAHDVTRRKRMEADLVEARTQAEAASRSKSQFLANMSHEIRTPLHGTLGMLQLLLASDLDQDQLRLAETAISSGRSLLSIIDDVLDFSRIEAGRIDLDESPFDPAALVESVVAVMKPLAREKGLDLAADLDPDLPRSLLGDQGRLRQVLVNLVGNSVKFTDQGGIRLELWRVGQDRGRARLLFTVADTGMGIPEDKLGVVFDSFTQVDGTSSRRHQGTGLGLGIVKRLVARMGGTIAVESVLGQGTAMHVGLSLPLAEEREPGLDGPSGQDRTRVPQAVRLLVAEDNVVNRLFLVRMLERMGHVVTEARDGREALAALQEADYDAVFMDVQMPSMDGLEAVQRMRRGEAGEAARTIPVVAVTAHAMDGDRERFLAQGLDYYIAKPMDQADLVRVLAELAQGRATRS